MDIWIFNHYAIAPGTSGITRHYDLARELVKMGHNVTIFASSFDHQTRKEKHITENNVIKKEENYEGVHFVWIKTPPYRKNDWRRVLNILFYTIRTNNVIKELQKHNPDVIIGSLMHPLAPILAYLISSKKNCKFFFEERDLWPQSLVDLGKLSKKNPIVFLLSKLEMFLYKKADRIIVLFDKAIGYVESRGVNREKVIYLPNGVHLSKYDNPTPLPEEHNAIFEKLKGKFICIYTGAHGLANNLDAMLDAAKVLDAREKIHFVLVGDGPEKERLIKRKQNENLSNITFLPPVSKEQVPEVLKRSNVGLITMWDADVYKWGFSLNKSYDYMAAKLPIILKCHIKNNLIEKSGAVIRVDNSNEMAKEIENLYLNKGLLKDLGQKSREFVEQNNSWEKLASILDEEINKYKT